MTYEGKSLYLDFSSLPDPGNRFKLDQVIGEGNYGEVYQGIDTENGKRSVAIKILENLPDIVIEAEEEYRILKDLSHHPNFPEFYGAFLKKKGKVQDDQLWFVMELCEGGPVTDLVQGLRRRDERLKETLIAFILKETIQALRHLHLNHIMHRDIKGQNILLTQQGQIKLVDFGVSRHLKQTMGKRSTAIGTPYWMAPEVILNEDHKDWSYDNRCDVWSLGIAAIEIGDGEPPLFDAHPIRAMFQIVHNPPPVLKKVMEWTPTYNDFIAECLVKNPDHRPVIMELEHHPFIEDISENTASLRSELANLLEEQSNFGKVKRRLEVLTKSGHLKLERKSPMMRIFADDLACLDSIDEDTLLDHLGQRLLRGQIHTFAGDILLVMNPFEDQQCYSKEFQAKYKFKARSDEEPHIYAVADRAWQDMMHHKEHQNIVLGGESGSGKTYNFLRLIQQLSYLAMGPKGLSDKLQTLPFLLDAFGNASTYRNDSSTRHIRYFEFTFSQTGKLSGAVVSFYMLEKSRVTRQVNGANFLIFYYLYYGLKAADELEKYYLNGYDLNFLPKSPRKISLCQYVSHYETLLKTLKEWDFTEQEQEHLIKNLAAILLLGQIDFQGSDKAEIANADVVGGVAELLEVDAKKLSWALLNYCEFNDGEATPQHYTCEEAIGARNGLAEALYSRLVDWFINGVNVKLSVGRLVFGDCHSLGILDGFGYESWQENSLEQLIINLTNEQLLYHYIQHVFVWEMQDYKTENIETDEIPYFDNRPILDLILTKPEGLLSFLDEESKSTGSADNFLAALDGLQKSQLTVESPTFSIQHFHGPVTYNVNDFMDKNRDFIPPELIDLVRQSNNPILAVMFKNKMTKSGHVTVDVGTEKKPNRTQLATGTKRFNTSSKGRLSQTRQMQTMSMQLRHSLIELLQKLVRGTPHFVRCIKPNNKDLPMTVNATLVRRQVDAWSLLPTIRIRQTGYSCRIPFKEFLRRYQFLAFDYDETVEMTPENCRLLLIRLKIEGWTIGKSKVFLKYYNEEYLSRLYESQVRKIVKVQSVMRVMLAQKFKLGKAGKQGKLSRDEAATAIQRNFRGYQVRKEYGPIVQRQRFQSATMEEEAANIIQYYWKKWKTKSLFQQLQLYRADKQQKLVYFCQQVHLYNQEFCGYIRKWNNSTSLGAIQSEKSGAHHQLIKPLAPTGKIPLSLRNLHFLDTTFMCASVFAKGKGKDQTQEKIEKVEEEWDEPMKKIAPIIVKKSYNQPKPQSGTASKNVRIRTPVEEKQSISTENALRTYGFQENGKNVGLARPVSPNPALNVHVAQWESRNDQRAKSPTKPHNANAKPPNWNVAKEMEDRAAKCTPQPEQTENPAPFNFQGMLRKTNYSRGSMKRSGLNGPGVSPRETRVYEKRNDSPGPVKLAHTEKKIQSKPHPNIVVSIPANGTTTDSVTSPTRHELAPGFIVEGEEAEL